MGNINSAIEQSSLPDPNPTFDTGLPIVNESNEDAKKVRYIIDKSFSIVACKCYLNRLRFSYFIIIRVGFSFSSDTLYL